MQNELTVHKYAFQFFFIQIFCFIFAFAYLYIYDEESRLLVATLFFIFIKKN